MLIEIAEQSQTGDARRKVQALAAQLQIDERLSGEIALATMEMATNLVKHAGKGHILVQRLPLPHNGTSGIRIISVDKGPGITDVSKALAGGNSTVGSYGSGLGVIRRMSSRFDLYSVPGSGTVVTADFLPSKSGLPAPAPIQVAVVSEPVRSEEVCGDGWAVRHSADGVIMMVVDGLGHGMFAAEAAREAERIFAATASSSLSDFLYDTHAALRKTRGAAFAIAKIEIDKGLLSFAGVGNVVASLVSPGSVRSMASHNGTVGQQMLRMQEFNYPWNPESIFVMHSDGLSGKWDLGRYPGIWSKTPSVIAALLYRDFSRERDDATVLVAKAAQLDSEPQS